MVSGSKLGRRSRAARSKTAPLPVGLGLDSARQWKQFSISTFLSFLDRPAFQENKQRQTLGSSILDSNGTGQQRAAVSGLHGPSRQDGDLIVPLLASYRAR